MNKPWQIDRHSERIFLPPPKKDLSKKDLSKQKLQKVPADNSKSKKSVYPDVRMPEQPDGFLKAKRHTLF